MRRNAQRRQPPGIKPAFDPELFRARFALLRRTDDGHPDPQLIDLFAKHPRIGVVWQALQEIYGLYEADDREGALEALDRFTYLYATGEIPEFGDVVDTFLA